MGLKRVLTLLVAAVLVTLIAVAAREFYVVRDLLAALLMFCTLLAVFGILVLVSFLLGEGVMRCVALLAASMALFRFHRPVVVGHLARGIGKS